MKFKPATIFALLVAVIMGLAVFSATNFPPRTAIYPLVAGSYTLVMALLCVVTELRGAGRVGGSGASGGLIDLEADRSIPASVRARKAIRVLAWLLGLYLAIWLLGFKLAVVSFLTAYVGIEARARWFLILGLMALLVFVLFMFERFLEVFWLEGLLNQWLQEPLPWLF